MNYITTFPDMVNPYVNAKYSGMCKLLAKWVTTFLLKKIPSFEISKYTVKVRLQVYFEEVTKDA